VLAAMARMQSDGARFALRGVAWSLALFGLLRLSWIEAHALLPFTRVQAATAVGLFGPPALPVEVTLACSGTDAIALCLGAVFAYPVGWRRRLAGAGAGFGLILALNILRIGTLGMAAASGTWFNALHVYLWPALLTLAIAGYVFGWMRLADRPHARDEQGVAREPSPIERPPSTLAPRLSPPSSLATGRRALQPTRRFVVLTVAFLLLFTAASPLYLQSAGILQLAGFIARAAAGILAVVGVDAYAVSNVLWTSRGSFLVTQECVSTPLLPVYLAAVCAHSTTWRRLIVGVIAAAPLFIALGIARLLVVALPDAVTVSPLFLAHAFYQLLLGAAVVFIAAQWRHGGRSAPGHALLGVLLGVLFVEFLGPFYTRLVTYPAGVPGDDPQGAIAFLPAFQVGLYLALWVAAFVAVGWTRFLTGLALLQVTQTAFLLALHALASPSALTAHVRDVRGWAVAGPLLIVAAVVNGARPRR
jgi:exosortase/archaeosortase family protein